MLREDSINIENNITPFRFAKKFDVNINPQNSGKWEMIDDINPDYALDSLYKIILASNPLQ